MIKEHGSLVEMMALWLSRQWPGTGHRLCGFLELESSRQLELWALMVQECQFEVVKVPDVAESNEGQQYVSPVEHVCLPCRALCVAVSVLNNSTMARNFMPDTVIKSSDVGGAAGGTGGVAGGSVEVA